MNRSNILVSAIAVGLSLLVGGSSFLSSAVYSSIWWSILWLAVLAAIEWSIIKCKLWNNIPLFLLHLSFVFMITGGFCTSFFSERGMLHLRPDQEYDLFDTETGKTVKLPSTLRLLSFSPDYYPGMNVPKDFRSEIEVETGDTIHISMNHIGKIGNFRFYQTSFDDDGGSILTVTHDPWGIGIVYSGFLLFALSGGWILVNRFRKSHKVLLLAVILSAGGIAQDLSAAGTSPVPAISREIGDSLSNRQVLFNGDVVPFNTVATRLTYKLTGRGDVAGLSPEVFVASLIQYKNEWVKVPFLKIKSDRLRKALKIKGDYASLSDLYNERGQYRPGVLYEGGRGKMDKDIMALDEKVALLIDLWSGKMFTPLDIYDSSSGDDDALQPEHRSDLSVKAEIAYNKFMPVRALFMGSITLALLILILLITKFDPRIKVWWILALWAVFGCACFVWKCLISAHFPLSATYEMMEFTGIVVLIIAAWVSRSFESQLPVALALLCASFLFLVAWIGYKDPVMTPVMPVLASPWLSIHVSLVMMAYAILGFTLPVSFLALVIPDRRARLTELSFSLISPGVYLLGLGIIAGAMWANVSWGRYWAWDPKETWALVTMLLYAIPLHRQSGMRKSPVLCNLYIVLIFSSILMTYFGVNYLPSLHAYK